MIDVQFTKPLTGLICPLIVDKTDAGIRIYQKILILLLSSNILPYRLSAGTSLATFAGKINNLGDLALEKLGTAACALAKSLLDLLDRNLLTDITASALNSILYITITLTDGTTYTGALDI